MTGNSYSARTWNSSRRRFLGAVGGTVVSTAVGHLDDGLGDDVSAAWIYDGRTDDLGWTDAHHRGLRGAVDELGEVLEAEYVENVDPADVEGIARRFAADGFDVVFGTTSDFTAPIERASETSPDVAFEVASGTYTADNLGAYYGKIYQARYLVGHAAGLVTETDEIGYVASNPVSTVLQDINGFAAGVRDVTPDATVHLRWTNEWFDPALERETAQALVDDENVDVLAQHQDSPAVVETANENDVWGSGFNTDMSTFGGENYLTSPVWNWDVLYLDRIEAVRAGDWEAGVTFPGMADGVSDISAFGPNVPDQVVDAVIARREELLEGDADAIVWRETPFENWSDAELLFEVDSIEVDNVEPIETDTVDEPA
ncbi:BMP family ABC transporter substrate-binding protein [Natrialbaceae archaeon AArc-T1-2]|uniref:BMP family ABC transporter substrate-binding protein n=1 Tax=Natrialbaceae archaeon AArc-T1-2 TaxID=3053904 RepID=UPI00255B055D|nr:BMP family ABC transporter substrate-binding protein [Natrialbaceae archaeon AArc-T1-2]WIV68480.1 BMP family ABC transporter substrate-binding protein [Natrialbaceae archaeon AArc-T1-2]